MKPAIRLAQIICDTPNWEQNPQLVLEVQKLRKQVNEKIPRGPKATYQYKMYKDDELVFSGSMVELSKFIGLGKTTIYQRCVEGTVINGVRIERQVKVSER
ncbi:hypothetical protein [Lysinibacillus piscis]|uniref:Uncharacterized protein n=1 Tax=Lysinibacillus piscis TaxID=2518931 RepID=A0ABQ5NLY3_9BACI|nr:hypothetical protein [Lysinibacillus sp. KH24]GLC89368.1 hypothetical protein LYSBPC_24950 [Lysinibacillus sp. KH24]